MRNPCKHCLELDFCREGTYGEPCIRRRLFEEKIAAIRQEVIDTVMRQKEKRGGAGVERDKSKE